MWIFLEDSRTQMKIKSGFIPKLNRKTYQLTTNTVTCPCTFSMPWCWHPTSAPNKWSCEGYDRSLSSPLATFCFEAKIVNWPSRLWNQRQPLLWKTVLITSGYGSNLPSTRLSIQWINMYTKFRDHWTMANCSLSKLQICAFAVTTLLEAERLLESHLKLASANGPRSIENLWRKATESVLLQDCKIWTQQIT